MNISDYTISFQGAGQQPIMAIGRFLRVRDAQSAIRVSFDGSAEIELEKGEQADLGSENVRCYISSEVGQVVKLRVSANRQDDNRPVTNVSAMATVVPSNNSADQPAVSVLTLGSARLAQANGLRKEIEISVASTEAGGVWVGGSTIGNARGSFIEPGMSKVYESAAEWWAYNPNASTVVVQVLELERI